MNDIESELLGVGVPGPGARLFVKSVAAAPALVVKLSDNTEARVGSTVYITPAGAKKIIDDMFKAMGVKDLDGALTAMLKMVPATDQVKMEEKLAEAKATFSKKIKNVGTLPFIVSAIAADKVDLKSTDHEVSDLPGVPASLLVGKPQPGSALDFLSNQYGPLPLWQWGLVGVGTIGIGILVIRALRK